VQVVIQQQLVIQVMLFLVILMQLEQFSYYLSYQGKQVQLFLVQLNLSLVQEQQLFYLLLVKLIIWLILELI